MSKGEDLSTLTKRVQVVIDPRKEFEGDTLNQDIFLKSLMSKMEELKSLYGFDFAYIMHDDALPHHIHLLLVSDMRHTLKFYLKRIANICCIANLEQIQVMTFDDLANRLQYLVHKNDTNKKQYDLEDIISSYSIEFIKGFIEQEKFVISFEALEELYDEVGGNMYKFKKKIGIGTYNTYRNSISDFINDYKSIYRQKLLMDGANECYNEVVHNEEW